MAAEMAVESTVQEMETTVQEGRSVRAEIAQEDHSEITLREEAASAATVQEGRSARVQIVQDAHSARALTVQEDHLVITTREEVSAAIVQDVRSVRVQTVQEDHSERAETVQEDRSTLQRRASTRRISTTSATRMRAESTR